MNETELCSLFTPAPSCRVVSHEERHMMHFFLLRSRHCFSILFFDPALSLRFFVLLSGNSHSSSSSQPIHPLPGIVDALGNCMRTSVQFQCIGGQLIDGGVVETHVFLPFLLFCFFVLRSFPTGLVRASMHAPCSMLPAPPSLAAHFWMAHDDEAFSGEPPRIQRSECSPNAYGWNARYSS